MLLKSSDGDFENDNLKKAYKSISNELLSNLMNGVSSDMVSEYGSFSDDAAVSGFCLYRDANDPSASVPLNLNVANGTYDYCSNGNSMSSLFLKHYYAPPFHFNRSCVENENWERDLASTAGDIEAMNPLVDLSGDYDSHIRSLLYGQCCYGFALSARQNSFWQTNWNGMLVEPAAQPSGNALPSTATLGTSPGDVIGWTRSKAPGSHGQLHLHSGTHSNECIAFSDANHSKSVQRRFHRNLLFKGCREFVVTLKNEDEFPPLPLWKHFVAAYCNAVVPQLPPLQTYRFL
ncbi:hypothetical protein HAX54_043640, partial [Datura stramonium]|nr:hypothetical protein [Datura stramonium]